jgi:hypothetical protein
MEKSNGSWNEWAHWVFENIARHDKGLGDLNAEFIQFKMKFYGFLGGFIAVVLTIIYVWLKDKL